MTNGTGLASVNHVVVLMLENRSFDHMLGFLYPGNVSPSGQPFAYTLGWGTPLDHTSVLMTVEQRWNLPALNARDAAIPGFGDVLTLATPPPPAGTAIGLTRS